MRRRRLDTELVGRGLAKNKDDAGHLIGEGHVMIDGAPAGGPATLVASSSRIALSVQKEFVGRGGAKLNSALLELEVSAEGARCLDAGAGTGGFTDCLLQMGASGVVAVDVGYGQFDWGLRSDPRVLLKERTNLRKIKPSELEGPFDLIVGDLSFISLETVLDVLTGAASEDADILLLVKPQFEIKRRSVPRGGVVRDPQLWKSALERVGRALAVRGYGTVAIVPSRLPGAEGNREFFIWARRDVPSDSADGRLLCKIHHALEGMT